VRVELVPAGQTVWSVICSHAVRML
jgi:hypothetical protein